MAYVITESCVGDPEQCVDHDARNEARPHAAIFSSVTETSGPTVRGSSAAGRTGTAG